MNSNNYQHITHESIKPFIDNNSFILILGSFPSIKTREVGFYYGHPQNRFYKVISNIFNEQLPTSIEEKKELLVKHHIALYDVIYSCDISNSEDSSIRNVTPINIKELLDKFPNINRIIVNGNKAKELFNRYLIKDIDTQNIEIGYAPSTSSANAKMSLEQLVEIYKQFII
ncbi:MAG: DNA-deoxyinosine glycosylase [Bacilli bacterium]|nr:DNA-deoxyinosine glycosylase [Bacilli bacterium]